MNNNGEVLPHYFFFCNIYKSELYNNQNDFDWDMSLKKVDFLYL